jgi:hypothetical protein
MRLTFKHPLLLIASLSMIVSGCLVTPVEKSGALGSVTVTNSNPSAIIAALQNVFPQYGYTQSGGHYPSSVSFNKDSNKIANVMWGSYGQPQTIHVKVSIIPIPGTNNYRLSPKVYTVTSQGEAGFESKRPLIGLWNSQFEPLLEQVSEKASGAGGL